MTVKEISEKVAAGFENAVVNEDNSITFAGGFGKLMPEQTPDLSELKAWLVRFGLQVGFTFQAYDDVEHGLKQHLLAIAANDGSYFSMHSTQAVLASPYVAAGEIATAVKAFQHGPADTDTASPRPPKPPDTAPPKPTKPPDTAPPKPHD